MTVAQLKKKLNKMPEDAKVVIYNSEMYIPNLYHVTGVNYNERDNVVEIVTDYEKAWE